MEGGGVGEGKGREGEQIAPSTRQTPSIYFPIEWVTLEHSTQISLRTTKGANISMPNSAYLRLQANRSASERGWEIFKLLEEVFEGE